MRCLALAEALEATGGWHCGFAAGSAARAMVPGIGKLACKPLALAGRREDEAEALAENWPDGCDLLVVDHYRRDEQFERACRPWTRRIMVIDDLADRKHDCEVLLDQTLGRQTSDYVAHVPAACQLMLGPQYALLRPEFAAVRPKALQRRGHHRPIGRILVTLGASDPDNVTSLVLKGIEHGGIEAAVDVVLGQGAPHWDAVKKQIARSPLDITLHSAATNMAELMGRADLAIGAAGTTSWERCCLGLPTLMVITAENQRLVAEQLNDAGAAMTLGPSDELTAVRIGDVLNSLIRDADRLAAMAKQAMELCDGRGLDRAILALAAGEGRKDKWLRLAKSDDGPLMFEWQRHPETRRFARNPKPPTWEEHSDWMERVFSDADILLMLIMVGDEPAGVLRLDKSREPAAGEISIYVAPGRHGQGIAGGGLRCIREIFPGWTFNAEVLPGNRASHALFRAAGYCRRSDTQYVSKPAEALN